MFRSKDEAAGYLAGMIDGEGSISGHDGNKRHAARQVLIHNTDFGLLERCVEAYTLLGIRSYIQTIPQDRGRRRTLGRTCVSGMKNLEKVRDLIPMQSEPKCRRLDEAIARYVQPWLFIEESRFRELYEDQELSEGEVAGVLGCSRGAVQRGLERFGIKGRGRARAQQIRRERERALAV